VLKAGVYAIHNLENGRMYVGSTTCIRRRWSEHRSMLYRQDHVCHDLQAEWDLYGDAAFVFVVLALSDDRDARFELEQFYINRCAVPYNTNGRAGSGPRPGYRHSEASKAKMSAAKLGKKWSLESRARFSASKKGIPNPAHGDALRGRKHSAETIAKMSAAKLGKKWSVERRERFKDACKSLKAEE
jgi:group I intron endonuclease